MPGLTRFHSFLDRFEERLQMDCERLKRQLVDQVEMRFGDLRAKVIELRNGFGRGDLVGISPNIDLFLRDDPPVQNVSLDDWTKEHCAVVEEEEKKKRKLSSTSGTVKNKRQKTATTDGSNKHQCKSVGCGKSFVLNTDLARHERIHLGIKPFSCTWPDCKYSSNRRGDVVTHIRFDHFKLPRSVKKQIELNIEDGRDPNQFVQVDQQLASRRL